VLKNKKTTSVTTASRKPLFHEQDRFDQISKAKSKNTSY